MATKPSKEDSNATNPTLRAYFRYMVTSKKLTIQFTQGRIRDIIRNDLNINFESFSELLKDVSTEAFAFYIQGWPGWQSNNFQNCIDDPEEAYKIFRKYLRQKIISLKDKEKEYVHVNEKTGELYVKNLVLNAPEDVFQNMPNDFTSFKIKLPYTLEITGNPNVVPYMNFTEMNNNIVFNLCKPTGVDQSKVLTSVVALNHPYICVQFEIPNLMKFTRKNLHKIEMFLSKPSDAWSFPKQDLIIDIKKYPARNNIYTAKFLQAFFNKFNEVITSYKCQIEEQQKREIMTVFKEFLSDIKEANLVFSTIQECTEIMYSIGHCIYYSDTAQTKADPVNFRRVYLPQVQFSLPYCYVQQTDIRPDGTFKYFDFHAERLLGNNKSLTEIELDFIKNINSALSYSCTMCNEDFECMAQLKNHLVKIHPCTEIVICSKCKSEAYLYQLLMRRWKHTCK